MSDYNLDDIICLIQEKKLQNIPSKGRNQWDFLKEFDGKPLGSFIESAKEKTASSPKGTFQESNWWEREIAWNIKRGNIRVCCESIGSDSIDLNISI